MELLILILAVMAYFWIVIPIIKRKIGYRRPKETTIFYDYKTKWQFGYEAAIVVICIACTILLSPWLGDFSILFVPVAFLAILLMRGKLEYEYHPQEKYHIISYVHAGAIVFAFAAVAIYGQIIG